jgi:nascent polypeptide-associated complex subunit alpha
MPSVSDELAALRSKGAVKQHANALKSKSGRALSTPEAEEASLAKLKKEDKAKKAQAEELLRKTNSAGGGLVDEELKKVGDRKKMFEKGRVEAKTLLTKGASAVVGKFDVSSDSAVKSDKAVEMETAPPAKAPKAATEKIELKDSSSYDDVLEIEESREDDVPDLDDEVPDLEEEVEAQEGEEPSKSSTAAHTTTNRNEKKVRKLMSRLDMHPVPGIARAVMKTSSGNFYIERPDVFLSSGGNKNNETYVIFGEARQQQSPLANLSRSQNALEAIRQSNSATVEEARDESSQVVVDEAVNEEGLEAKDIELVMAQASVEKSVAVKVLRENNGDLVNAIMSLTT